MVWFEEPFSASNTGFHHVDQKLEEQSSETLSKTDYNPNDESSPSETESRNGQNLTLQKQKNIVPSETNFKLYQETPTSRNTVPSRSVNITRVVKPVSYQRCNFKEGEFMLNLSEFKVRL